MNEAQKFVETLSAAPVVIGSGQLTEAPETVNPLVPKPQPTIPMPTETPISNHDKLWYDTKQLILSAKRLGVDFEVLLRGALQEIDKGL